MPTYLKPLRRKIGVLGLLLVLCMLAKYLNWHVNRPFKAHSQFIQYLRHERFDEAKGMIDAADLAKIPDKYWEQFRGRPPESLINPTGATFINGKMVIEVMLPGGEFPQLRVSYVTEGYRIRVHSMPQ